MSVIRVVHNRENPYVIIHKSVLEIKELSFKAKGLWAYCMSRKDDWHFRVKHLQTVSKDGEDAIYSAINELIEHGICQRKQEMVDGRWRPVEYIIYETAEEFKKCLPQPDFPDAVFPDAENPDSLISKEKESSKDIRKSPPSPQEGEVPTEVETLYNHFLEKIKEKNPTFKVKNPKVWKGDLEKIMRIDKKSFSDVLSMIDWVSQDPFWKSNVLSPDKLREKFSELEIKRLAQSEKNNIEKNKKYCLQAKAKFPQELKDLVLTSTYAMNKANGKDVSLNWPYEKFRPAFVAIFGGEVHG